MNACCASGIDRGADDDAGTRRLHRGPNLDDERRQSRSAEVTPAFRKKIRVRGRVERFPGGRLAPLAIGQVRRDRRLELFHRGGAVVEVLVRKPHVIQVNAVDGILRGDLADDGGRMILRRRVERRGVEPFDDRRVRARPSRQPPDVGRAAQVDLLHLRGKLARHHQPLGRAVDDVIARRRQAHRARHQVHRHPRVDLKPGGMRIGDHRRERIERWLARQLGRPWLDRAGVVRVAASPNLHEQRVESAGLRGRHHLPNRFRRRQRRPRDPECTRLLRGRGSKRRRCGDHQQRESAHPPSPVAYFTGYGETGSCQQGETASEHGNHSI